MKSINKIGKVSGKKIIVRVDFNVPIVNGKIIDDFRIKKTIPTIEYLQKRGGILILISHLGKDGHESFYPFIKIFKKYIKNFYFAKSSALSDETEDQILKLKKGDVLLLDNIRKEKSEEKNEISFARGLSRLADIYVNEAFSCSHRDHASIVGLPKFLPSYAGFQLEDEIEHLSSSFDPKHPFLFILGGAKFETKIPLLKKFLKTADNLFIGGALSSELFRAKGFEIGESFVGQQNLNLKIFLKNPNLFLPTDIRVISGSQQRICKINEIKKDEKIVDIGPESVKILEEKVKDAKYILFNGPLGQYEDGFSQATEELLKIIAQSSARSIIGGGDTVALVSKLKLEKKLGFVSTGGGATLDFLTKGTLPGIKALK